MSIRRSFLPLFAAALLALVSTVTWAQDGRGHGRGGHPGQGAGQDRGGRGDGMRDAPRARPMIAEPRRQPERGLPEPQRQRREDGLAESVRRIERSTRGRVINAERVQSDGHEINRIKVMDDRGRIRVYMDDPRERDHAPTRGDDN